MIESVSLYNPDMPKDLKEEALRKNSEVLSNLANNSAVNLLISSQNKTAELFNTSTLTNMLGMNKAFTSNGGSIFIFANIHGENAYAGYNIFALFLDGVEKVRKAFGAGATGSNAGVTLFWIENLAAGNHKVEIKAAVSAGGVATPLTNYTNELFVIEILL